MLAQKMTVQSFQEAQERDFMPLSVYIDKQQHDGYFANIRIDRRTLPDGWYAYDIRKDDSDGIPCQIVDGYVYVNHFGTFCTQTPLPLEDGDVCELGGVCVNYVVTRAGRKIQFHEKLKSYLRGLSNDELMQVYNDFAESEIYPCINYMYDINDTLRSYSPSDILRMANGDFDIDDMYYILHDNDTLQSDDSVKSLVRTETTLGELAKWLYENKHNLYENRYKHVVDMLKLEHTD